MTFYTFSTLLRLPTGHPILGPGMVFAMDLFELSFVDMGVDLGGCYVCVTEKFLNDSKVGTTGQKMGRKTMP